jgi:aromatic ring-opening dioxygenase catalytic subunit (LigB family)
MTARQPTIYLSHGGGPSFWVEYPPPIGPRAFAGLKTFLQGAPDLLPEPPRAFLVVTAHWETPEISVSAAEQPDMIYDYYGFPPVAYTLSHPAPGEPALAGRVDALLRADGIPCRVDAARGFDHGVFVPMMVIDPAAATPTVSLSLREDLDPDFHHAVGAALAPLRDEGVCIIGSGSSFHNLRTYFDGRPAGEAFDAWLTETASHADPEERRRRLSTWDQAPEARAAHPREEHLLPLMVAAGAASGERGRQVYSDTVAAKPFSAYLFG